MKKAIFIQSICPQCKNTFSYYCKKQKTFCTHSCFLKHPKSPETCKKLSDALKGIIPKNIKYFQEKGRLANIGKKHTEEHKRKISLSNSGRIISDETKQKISIANGGSKNGMYGSGDRQLGENNPSWKGGVSLDKNHLLKMSRLWRKNNPEKHRFNSKQYEYRLRNAVGKHSLQEWNELKEKFGYMCLCCKRCEPEVVLSEDHIVPLSKGGSNNIFNIQPLCISCNSRKRDKEIDYISNFVNLKQHEF